MSVCGKWHKHHVCSLPDTQHDVCMAINPAGVVMARWRWEAHELPLEQAIPAAVFAKAVEAASPTGKAAEKVNDSAVSGAQTSRNQ